MPDVGCTEAMLEMGASVAEADDAPTVNQREQWRQGESECEV